MSRGMQCCISKLAIDFTVAFALLIAASLPAQVAHAQTFQVLHNFSGGGDGASPRSGVTMDAAGNLYGTTSGGGQHNYGSVFRLKHSASGWLLNPLYSFTGGADGADPWGRVAIAPDGTLYGNTLEGGSHGGLCGNNGCGVIYRLQPPASAGRSALVSWTETVVNSFHNSGGKSPEGDLLFDRSGNIYGTTYYGGMAEYYGTIYSLTEASGSWTENLLVSLENDSPEGTNPHSGLVMDAAGNLYGTYTQGGQYDAGSVFELSNSGGGWTDNAIYAFSNGNDGGYPIGGLVQDALGNFYGTTPTGGAGQGGTVFQLAPSNGGWTLNTIVSFTSNPAGCGPIDTLALDAAGNLYGTTQCDSPTGNGYGEVFMLTPSEGGWTYTALHDFNGADGDTPIRVVLGADGTLYGTTNAGGSSGFGVVFAITP